jgi:heme oxygenase
MMEKVLPNQLFSLLSESINTNMTIHEKKFEESYYSFITDLEHFLDESRLGAEHIYRRLSYMRIDLMSLKDFLEEGKCHGVTLSEQGDLCDRRQFADNYRKRYPGTPSSREKIR